MRLSMNQPHGKGMGAYEDEYQFAQPKTAIPPASTGLFSTITGGIQEFIKNVTSPEAVKMVLNRTLYGSQAVPAATMYQTGAVPPALAPKTAISGTMLAAGAGLLAVILLSKKGKRR